jgi:hypothetical protein
MKAEYLGSHFLEGTVRMHDIENLAPILLGRRIVSEAGSRDTQQQFVL